MKASNTQFNVTQAAAEMNVPAPKLHHLLAELGCPPDSAGNFTVLDLLRGLWRTCPDDETSRRLVIEQMQAAAERAFR